MEPQEIIDLGRGAIKACLMIGGPILLASLVVGLLVGVLQAMVQVPDQSVSFVPKLICLVLVIAAGLPWLTDRMLDYSREAFATPISLRNPAANLQQINLDRTAAKDRLKEPQRPMNSRPLPFPEDQPNQEPQQEPIQKPNTKPNQEYQPSKPPFQLPNYRFSRLPTENQSG